VKDTIERSKWRGAGAALVREGRAPKQQTPAASDVTNAWGVENERETASKPRGDGRWKVAAPFLRLGAPASSDRSAKTVTATRGARATPGGTHRGRSTDAIGRRSRFQSRPTARLMPAIATRNRRFGSSANSLPSRQRTTPRVGCRDDEQIGPIGEPRETMSDPGLQWCVAHTLERGPAGCANGRSNEQSRDGWTVGET
jgi:hypothetical protein